LNTGDAANEMEKASQKGSNAFVAEVARYYRDFLETDFRKSRAPSRQVRIRDESGSPLGFNVRRYPSLFDAIVATMESPFGTEITITVRRGQHTQRVSSNVQRLLRAQINALDDGELREAVNKCVYSLKQRAATGPDNFDQFVDDAQELISERVMSFVVTTWRRMFLIPC